jgi:translation initiation factor 2 subunit 1
VIALFSFPFLAPQKCEERFAKSKMVHSIMRHVAETTGQNLEQLYTDIAWPLYRMYGHAHTAFSTMVTGGGLRPSAAAAGRLG